MAKLLRVAREEILFYLRQWTFYVSLAVMVLTFVGAGALPQLRQVAEESPLAEVETIFTVEETVSTPTGYVDYAGIVRRVPEEQAENFRAFDQEEAAAEALRAGEIEGYYVIAADFMDSGKVEHFSRDPQLFTRTDAAVSRLLRENVLLLLDDPALAERVKAPFYLNRVGPPQRAFSFIPADLDFGQLASAGLVIGLFAFLINGSGMLLLHALHRESEKRILEILISSTTPVQFLGGKMLGLSTLVLFQAGLSLLGGLMVYGRSADPGLGGAWTPTALPSVVIAWAIPYFLLGYLGYSATMLSVAAVFPMLKESFQFQFLMRFLVLTPAAGALFILPNAHSATSVFLTVFPLTAPLLMPFRMLLAEVPLWQAGLGLGLMLGWDGLVFGLATRLFRAHSLLTGRPPTVGAVWSALRG